MEKRMPDNAKTQLKLEKLPRIWYVGFWAHWGVRSEYLQGFDKDGHPLVWYFNDHNGTYAEWILTRLENTTTGAIVCWGDEARRSKLAKIARALENARERKDENSEEARI